MTEATRDVTFERLMRLHERPLLALAYRLTGNLADAQDVTQEVFFRLHRHLPFLEGAEDGIARWLRRVAINVCADLARRGKVQALTPMPAADPRSTDPSPDELATRADRERRLVAALGRLGERERAALVLRELEGLSTAEVAAVMGSSEATIRVQISKARLKLRDLLRGVS
jgi:RNA polymerase sigma-70 factor (ECF subfamily)